MLFDSCLGRVNCQSAGRAKKNVEKSTDRRIATKCFPGFGNFDRCFLRDDVAPIGKELMRGRVLLFLSLGANVALLLWFVTTHRKTAREGLNDSTHAASVKTNVVVRRQFFTWGEVESSDYPTYIANLRDIGCPEQTIRDIIIAEINTLYARRLATELVTPEQQWWRSEPDTNTVRAAAQKARELEDERRALLARLLGTNWESGDLVNLPRPSRQSIALDGPVLGALPLDVKEAVETVSARSQDQMQAYLDEQRRAGTTPDPAELARLRQQTRAELARLLTPAQLEEYLLRYSQHANNLRTELGQLKYFNATPDEFRAIFRAQDSIEQQLELIAGSNDPASALQRRMLEEQRDNAIKIALGPQRYAQYTTLHDSDYRDALAAAQQSGNPNTADTIYQINLATAQQQAMIRANTNLTPEQRAIELKRVELSQLTATAQATGQEVQAEQPPLPSTTEIPTAPDIRSHPYVLSVGDTVSSIAVRYGISMNELKAANPDVDFKKLRPGDALKVPDR
jgi:LysM repeat protein